MSEKRTIVGQVVRKRINAGSKSDREAVVLVSPEGTLALRRRGISTYTDTELGRLVGKRLRATGVVSAGQLIMHDFEVVEND